MATEQLNELPAATDVLPGDLSTIFRRHREEHGLNVNQVAEALCLSPKVIMAIEAENLDGLPEPPYVRGYLRSFAKYTEVDPTEMINAYEKLRGAKPNELDYHFTTAPATRPKKQGISSGVLKLGLLILLLGLLAILSMIPSVKDWAGNTWNQFSDKSDPGFTLTNQNDNPLLTGNIPAPLPIDNTSQDTSTDSTGVAPVVAGGTENAGFPGVGDAPVSADTPAVSDATAVTPDTASTEQAASDIPATDEVAAEETAPAEGTSLLKLTFNDEVWMRIRDNDKKKLFEALSQKGDSKELTLPRPMVVRVGNAQALELTVDGKPFDMTPFIRGSVANFTIE